MSMRVRGSVIAARCSHSQRPAATNGATAWRVHSVTPYGLAPRPPSGLGSSWRAARIALKRRSSAG